MKESFFCPGETVRGISKKPYRCIGYCLTLLNITVLQDSSCSLIKSKQMPSFLRYLNLRPFECLCGTDLSKNILKKSRMNMQAVNRSKQLRACDASTAGT